MFESVIEEFLLVLEEFLLVLECTLLVLMAELSKSFKKFNFNFVIFDYFLNSSHFVGIYFFFGSIFYCYSY